MERSAFITGRPDECPKWGGGHPNRGLADQKLGNLLAHERLPGFFLPLLAHLDLVDHGKVTEVAVAGRVTQNKIIQSVRSPARLGDQVF